MFISVNVSLDDSRKVAVAIDEISVYVPISLWKTSITSNYRINDTISELKVRLSVWYP